MTLGLLVLAVLGSLFAGALVGRWGQQLGRRITALRERLAGPGHGEDELATLERAVEELPLEILANPDDGTSQSDFREAGLVYVRLVSLARYVEALDEQSLLDYTEAQRRLIESVAAVYGGQLAVAREFGVVVSFSGSHASGSPAFRATAAAWLLQRVAGDLDAKRRLTYRLGLACGLGEAGSGQDIYPALYNQHIIDELAQHSVGESILLSPAVAADDDVAGRCRVEAGEGYRPLGGFMDSDRLERQRQLLLQTLG
jgi:hypothetical protein